MSYSGREAGFTGGVIELPQLVLTSCGNSLGKVMVTRWNDLW
uniref:Uncharacterized protein n=1 Tax=Myoviridae sp. ctfrL10 TaxID=2826678 RepID=A0A8S5MRX2_9CAUD|nr:MAG TPA: hypothetical protein [Myoviridae sp. ctfrL10]